jgi:hypothetical protein
MAQAYDFNACTVLRYLLLLLLLPVGCQRHGC